MKINKKKLKNMVEKGALVVTTRLKRKKIDEDQSSIPPKQSGLSLKKASVVQVPQPIPQTLLVVQISGEEIAMVQATDGGLTICRSHGLAAKRAEAAITKLNFDGPFSHEGKFSFYLLDERLFCPESFIYIYIYIYYFLVFERGDGD